MIVSQPASPRRLRRSGAGASPTEPPATFRQCPQESSELTPSRFPTPPSRCSVVAAEDAAQTGLLTNDDDHGLRRGLDHALLLEVAQRVLDLLHQPAFAAAKLLDALAAMLAQVDHGKTALGG